MKKIITTALLLFVFGVSTTFAQDFKPQYKELNQSYIVFQKALAECKAESFDNLKLMSEELMERSLELSTDRLPSDVVTGKVKETMAILKKQTKAVYLMITNGDSKPNMETIKLEMTKLGTTYNNLKTLLR